MIMKYDKAIRLIPVLASVGLVSACTTTDPLYRQFLSESGSLISDSVGSATAHNIRVMTDSDYYARIVAQEFANKVPDMITFDLNSAALDQDAKRILDIQARWIKRFPELRYRVYGHTDLTWPAAHNKALGLKRAQAVGRYLSSLGIPRESIESVISYGEERPLINTTDPERRNRRTVTEVSGYVKSQQRVFDGQYAVGAYRNYVGSGE